MKAREQIAQRGPHLHFTWNEDGEWFLADEHGQCGTMFWDYPQLLAWWHSSLSEDDSPTQLNQKWRQMMADAARAGIL